jgi:diacylglycerol kinase family enzyme
MLLGAAMNSATYGGGFPIAPMARPDDGRIEFVWAEDFGRMGVLGILPRLMLGRHLKDARIGHRGGVEVRVLFDRPVPLQSDGEVLPATEVFEVRIEPGALPIAADPGAREGLEAREERRPVAVVPEPTV